MILLQSDLWDAIREGGLPVALVATVMGFLAYMLKQSKENRIATEAARAATQMMADRCHATTEASVTRHAESLEKNQGTFTHALERVCVAHERHTGEVLQVLGRIDAKLGGGGRS